MGGRWQVGGRWVAGGWQVGGSGGWWVEGGSWVDWWVTRKTARMSIQVVRVKGEVSARHWGGQLYNLCTWRAGVGHLGQGEGLGEHEASILDIIGVQVVDYPGSGVSLCRPTRPCLV